MTRPATRSVRLGDLLGAAAAGHARLAVTGIATDSRQVRAGEVFFARPGLRADGRAFVAAALAAGAAAVVVPAGTATDAVTGPVLAVDDLPQSLARAAARWYGEPSTQLRLLGVTGTNGKTTVAHLLSSVLAGRGGCGVIGTLGAGLAGKLQAGLHTTPEVTRVQALLREFVERGAASAVMEVSSHGIAQGRIEALHFDTAVYTNLSRDHLDYHGDMRSYALVKSRLFRLPGLRHAVLNRDDPWAGLMAKGVHARLYGYTTTAGADEFTLAARIEDSPAPGLVLSVDGPWGAARLHSRLLGRFNAANLAAALTTLLCLDVPLAEACRALAEVAPPAGRMQWLGGAGRPVVVVDYAHTPDALRAVLEALSDATIGALWCVFGCGGDRDRGKRPEMGAVAEALASRVVITDDNPRGEASADIIDDILAGLRQPRQVRVEPDRAAAIASTIAAAGPHDVVLIAGKGHENYQERAGVRCAFSDEVEARRALGRYAAGPRP